MKEFISKENIQNTKIFNFACGSVNKSEILNYSAESSSSTIRKVDENSKYFKKKKFFIQGFSKNNFFLRLWLSAKIQIKSFDYYTLTVSKQLIIIIYLITISKGFAKPL